MDTEDKVFFAIATAVALIAHSCVRRFWVACVIVVLASPALYAIESFIRLDLPAAKIFWLPFVFLEGGCYALVIALVIGLPFYLFRRWRRHNAKPSA